MSENPGRIPIEEAAAAQANGQAGADRAAAEAAAEQAAPQTQATAGQAGPQTQAAAGQAGPPSQAAAGEPGAAQPGAGRALRATVVVASNRAAAGVYPDRTGPVIVEWLAKQGCAVGDPVVVPDGDPVAAALKDAVAGGVDVVLTTGGTGISPTDRTPEATRSVLDYEVPGLADAIRASGGPQVPTSVLSRGVAGVAG
ncbi:MAG TPA: MogA/MoaB family molybdenum cofactor biosynthesis protein, partial [Pseudonocardiaceae bacterium]